MLKFSVRANLARTQNAAITGLALRYSEKNNHPKIGDNGETIRWFFIDKPNG